MTFTRNSFILIFITILLFATIIDAVNITKILHKHKKFKVFNDLLSKTGVAAAIDGRRMITILVVDNSGMRSILSKPQAQSKNILATHVILDYYDPIRLAAMSKNSTTITNLFQTIGIAVGQQGFLNVTPSSSGNVIFASAVQGAPINSKMVKPVVIRPNEISVIQISKPIVTPGLSQNVVPSPSLTSTPSITYASSTQATTLNRNIRSLASLDNESPFHGSRYYEQQGSTYPQQGSTYPQPPHSPGYYEAETPKQGSTYPQPPLSPGYYETETSEQGSTYPQYGSTYPQPPHSPGYYEIETPEQGSTYPQYGSTYPQPPHSPGYYELEGPTQAPVAHQDGPTQTPIAHQEGPTQAPVAHQEGPTQSPVAHQEGPTQAPVAHQEDPTQAPVGHQEGPTQAPVAHQEGPTQAPVAHQEGPTQAPIAHQEGPTQAPVSHQESPTHAPIPNDHEVPPTHAMEPPLHEGPTNAPIPHHERHGPAPGPEGDGEDVAISPEKSPKKGPVSAPTPLDEAAADKSPPAHLKGGAPYVSGCAAAVAAIVGMAAMAIL